MEIYVLVSFLKLCEKEEKEKEEQERGGEKK
jgi:hypothetical protein